MRGPLQSLDETALPIFIMVDSLNEALTYAGRVTIVDLLAGSSDLPDDVRFLLDIRNNERRVLDAFDDVLGSSISPIQHMRPRMRPDISDYARRRLRAARMQPRIRAGTLPEDIVARIVGQAGRQFPVRCVLARRSRRRSAGSGSTPKSFLRAFLAAPHLYGAPHSWRVGSCKPAVSGRKCMSRSWAA